MQKLLKYLLVGGSAAVINWLIFFICAKIFGLYYLMAGLVSFFIATLWNFLLARKFIFTPKHSIFKESTLIYFVSFIGLCIDACVLYVCVEIFGLDSMIGKVIATGIAFFFNFSVRNFVIYK